MSAKCQAKKVCENCDANFSVNCARKNTAHYCSYRCYWSSKKGKPSPVLGKRWFLSPETRARMKGKNATERNWNWKGGIRKMRNYVLRHNPSHPFATKQGYVFEHRLVMEQILGRYLEAYERVHHINGEKADNRPENLLLTTVSEHPKLHPELATHIKGINRWK